MSYAAPALILNPHIPLAFWLGGGILLRNFNLSDFFQVVSVFGCALAALKLFQAGLHRRYKIFFAYLIFRIPYITLALFMDPSGSSYLWFFTKTEPIVMLFYVLIVIELYGLVLERYRGLYTLGRWAMGIAMTIAVVASMMGLKRATAQEVKNFSFWVLFELRAEARVDLALVLFILLIIWFLSRYPIVLNRNVVFHTIVYSIFFFANSVALVFWFFQMQIQNVAVNDTLMGISSACAVAWWIGLTQKGEEVQVNLPTLGPGAEHRALQQLEALNATLLKASRK